MTQYSCSICGYISDRKENVKTHINKKNKCGEGIAKVIETQIEIKCEFCNKKFSCKNTLNKHLNEYCKVHLQKQLEEKESKLKEATDKIKTLENKTPTTIINNNDNRSINITIQLRPYNDPKLPDDMDDIYEDAWLKKKSISTFIERLHLSEDLPENHSICIPNLRTKLGKVFTEQGWQTRDLDALLTEIITNTNRLLDNWVKAKPKRKEKYENDFIEYLEEVGKKQFNEDTKKELKLMLYDAYKNGIVNIKSGTKQYIPIQDDID